MGLMPRQQGNAKFVEPDCRSPEQMRLANGFCRHLELARTWNTEVAPQ